MSDTAKLLPRFAKRGVVPESGGTWFLPRLVGWAKACEIGFLADGLLPDRALELGLVNKVVPHDQLEAETNAWAEKIAAGRIEPRNPTCIDVVLPISRPSAQTRIIAGIS